MSISFDAGRRAVEKSAAPWLNHYPICTPAHLEYPSEPVWWLLEHSASRFPHRIAIRYFQESITYEGLSEQARRAATLFQSLGIQPGDRVGLLLPNLPEYLIAAYGVWMAGGIVVSLSPLSVAVEIDDMLQATDCKLVVALDLLAPLATQGAHRPERMLTCSIAQRLPTVKRLLYRAACLKRRGLHPSQQVPTSDFLAELSQVEPIAEPVRTETHQPAYILPTGGTTGRPKAVTLSHANLLANALQLKAWCGNRTGRDTFLAVIPFFHSYGLSTCATGGVAMAATLLLHHRFQPETVLDLIQSARPSVFPAVPAMLNVLNQRLREHEGKWNVKSLLWVISGGAPLMPETATEFSSYTLARVVEGYGLSECSPVTHAGPLDGNARLGTIGLPLPDTEAMIVNAETGANGVEPGEVGELIVRGPQIMLGYWNNPEATAQILRDGWLFTGDLATCDNDGYFKIVDRKKDLIITSGFNVYPNDVEYVLKQFPDVKDAAVVGVPDPQRGEIVKAIVAVKSKSHFHQHAFEKYMKTNLAHHKVPRILEVIDGDLPRNFLGKVLRRKLREPS
ncbi:MAG: long-chain fatty acid--CoA ligase [Planctomycetes bacterium]|nr:long-chain fatty acid--CoA ligase [Planctomycetota bacterium]